MSRQIILSPIFHLVWYLLKSNLLKCPNVRYCYGIELISLKLISCTKLDTCFLEKHFMTSPVNTLWDEFKDMCQRYLDHITTRLIATRCKQPWISPYIQRLSRRKQLLYNFARSSQCPFYWQKY